MPKTLTEERTEVKKRDKAEDRRRKTAKEEKRRERDANIKKVNDEFNSELEALQRTRNNKLKVIWDSWRREKF